MVRLIKLNFEIQSQNVGEIKNNILLTLENKENELKLIDSSFVKNIKELIKLDNEESISKLNSEISEYKILIISKDNEINKLNELLLTKKNEIISLKKTIEEQKNGTREREIEENFKNEAKKFTKKINDLEIKIYSLTEEKNNLIKTQKELQTKNEELMQNLNEQEEEIEKKINKRYFNNDNIKITQNDNFNLEKTLKKEDIDIEFKDTIKNEKEELISSNNKLKIEIEEIKSKYEELLKQNNNNNNDIDKRYKELEKLIEEYKSGLIIPEETKKMIENSKKNHELEIEQLKQKNMKEIEVLNLKNNLLINKNKERETKMKELINKIKVILIEKNELENVIILQEKKVNELIEKINKIDLIINKKNEKIKENEKCTLNLINIVNDQQKEIKKLKMKNSNQNKSLNDILTIKKHIKNVNDNLEQNKKSNIKSLKFSNSNLQERYLRAFSTTKKNRGRERSLLNNYLSNYNILKNDKKVFPKKRKLLQIKINNEGQYYSTSNINHPKKYNSNIPSKIGDDLVYLSVNMNWINTKTNNKVKSSNKMESPINSIKNKINLTASKLPNIIYSHKNNSRISKLNMLQNEEDEKKEEINQMMQKILDEI